MPEGILGPVMQLGYVVSDLEASAAAFRDKLGAGPFLHMPHVAFPGWTYKGAPQEQVLEIAFGQVGALMIELIRPLGPWPSVYGKAPPPPGEARMHHHGFLLSDMDAAAAALGAGAPVTTAKVGDAGELRYYDCRATLGLFVELISDTAEARAFFELSARAAREWDGGGPVLHPVPAALEQSV